MPSLYITIESVIKMKNVLMVVIKIKTLKRGIYYVNRTMIKVLAHPVQ